MDVPCSVVTGTLMRLSTIVLIDRMRTNCKIQSMKIKLTTVMKKTELADLEIASMKICLQGHESSNYLIYLSNNLNNLHFTLI